MFQIYEKWVGADALRASAVFGAMRAALRARVTEAG
jgi:hypothetical protein